MNGKNWYSVYFSSHFKGTNGFLCDFQFFYVSFRQQARNLVKMKKNIFACSISAGRYIFSNFREDAGLPELASGSTIGEPSTDSRKSESNKRFLQILLLSFFSSSLLLLHITSHSDRSRQHPSPPCHSRVPKLHCK